MNAFLQAKKFRVRQSPKLAMIILNHQVRSFVRKLLQADFEEIIYFYCVGGALLDTWLRIQVSDSPLLSRHSFLCVLSL